MTDVLARLTAALADRYTLQHELGAGGMATVYLAHDIKHDRQVAIKVLRPELAAVIGAERFLSEIKTTANLQHPHILPLFDSGESDSFLFYVMPFVEGESLRDRIAREHQLPVGDAVRLATEIAGALDYAHRHGIIHRDIKPENVMLHDGRALVADFGIALAMANTTGTRMTETGMSLGTPHYMSPEQAMGEREITGRSDVYALGAITYEMLVGEPPFTGPTAQAIIARVMTEEPRALTGQRKSIPPSVEAAIFTALEKLPADRYATAAEFASALADAGTTSRRVHAVGESASRNRVSRWIWPGLAAVLGAAALWGWLRPPAEAVSSQQRVVLWNFQYGDYLSPGSPTVEFRLAISPDGSTLVFADSVGESTQLFIKRQNDLRPTAMEGTEGAAGPFFSPDGEWIGYFAPGGKLRKVRTSGGGSVQLTSSVSETYIMGTWLDDGTIIYVDGTSGLSRVSGEGGASSVFRATDPAHRDDPSSLWALPGSKGVLFTGCPGNCASGSSLYVFDIAADSARLLVPEAVGGWYSPTGHLLFTSRDGGLYAANFDLKKMAVSSGAVSIMDGVAPGAVTLSRAGAAVVLLGTQDFTKSTLVSVDRAGNEVGFAPDWIGSFEYPALSPDGKSVAVSVREGSTQLWVRRPDGSRLRISRGHAGSWRPSWTADGNAFAFVTTGGMASATVSNDAYRSPIDGSVPPVEIANISDGIWEVEFSRDGNWLAIRSDFGAASGNFYAKRLHGDTALTLIHSDSSFNTQLAVSPDSRWLAFSSDRTGRSEVYVASFPDMQVKYPVSQGGGSEPRWARDGRELFFKSRGKLMAMPVAAGVGFAPGSAQPLFSVAPYASAVNRQQYDVGADGRFLMIRRPERGGSQEIVLMTNIHAELRAKAGK